jgi:hypothetical protein
VRWGPTLPVINLEKPPCSGRSAGWRALHCRGRCRRILSRCSVRRRGKTSSPQRLCDPRSSVSCAAVGLRARFTLFADHAASNRTSQNAPACAAAPIVLSVTQHRPSTVPFAPTIDSPLCTDHRQSTLHRPSTVLFAPTIDSPFAPTIDSPLCTDHRQSSLHRPSTVLFAPTIDSPRCTDHRQSPLHRPSTVPLHRPSTVLFAPTIDSPPCTDHRPHTTLSDWETNPCASTAGNGFGY